MPTNKRNRICMTVSLAFSLLSIFVFSGTASAERLAVTALTANIRSGPGRKFEIIWQAEKYTPLEIIKSAGKWYQFKDFEGDLGWIHQSLTGNIRTVITKQPLCNIRSGPGKTYPIRFKSKSGIPFKVLDQKGNWLHIQHSDGDTGWLHKSLIW